MPSTTTQYIINNLQSADMAIRAFCDNNFIDYKSLISKSRRFDLVCIRHSLFYLLHNAGASYIAIGRFYNRDHSTVIYAVRSAAFRQHIDTRFMYFHNKIKAILDPVLQLGGRCN